MAQLNVAGKSGPGSNFKQSRLSLADVEFGRIDAQPHAEIRHVKGGRAIEATGGQALIGAVAQPALGK
jgi:hypothetical protein